MRKKLKPIMFQQYYYFVSNEEIKEPCWCINKNSDTLYFIENDFKEANKDCMKVEATTDKSLKKIIFVDLDTKEEVKQPLPQIPQSFVKYFVEQNGKVDEVEVEMDLSDTDVYCDKWTLKLTNNNEVIIHFPEKYIKK